MNAAVRVPGLPERPRTALVLSAVFSLVLHAAFAALLWPSTPAVPEAVGNAIAVEVVARGPDLTPKSGTRAGAAAASAAPPKGAGIAPPPKAVAKPSPAKSAPKKAAPVKKPAIKKARPAARPQQTAARPSASHKPPHKLGRKDGKATGRTGGAGADSIATLAPSAGVPGPVSRGAAPLGSNAVPVYPERARTRGWEGRVLLSVDVTADGRTTSVTIARSSGHGILDRAARKAVKRWRFTPAMKAGVRNASTVTVPVRFVLR